MALLDVSYYATGESFFQFNFIRNKGLNRGLSFTNSLKSHEQILPAATDHKLLPLITFHRKVINCLIIILLSMKSY